MTNIHYLKDTKKFWRTREIAHKKLDAKRANASYGEKVTIAAKLSADAKYLTSGRVVTSKSSLKPSKT